MNDPFPPGASVVQQPVCHLCVIAKVGSDCSLDERLALGCAATTTREQVAEPLEHTKMITDNERQRGDADLTPGPPPLRDRPASDGRYPDTRR